MTEIPADVMEAVVAAFREEYGPDSYPGPVQTRVLARAIMAERERCAKVIEDNQEIVHMKSNARVVSPRTPGSLTGIAYAAAIRNPAP